MSPRPRFEDEQFSLLPVRRSEPRIPAHAPNSETSREAALRIAPKASSLRDDVLRVIIDAGESGATRKEIEGVTGMLTQTVTPRLVELEQAGEIRKWTYFSATERKVLTVKREGCSVYILVRGAA
jgi:hypothetical protein